MSIDKDRFVKAYTSSPKLYYPTPVRWADVSDKPFTPEELGPYWKFNPAEAKRLLIEAGFPDGKMKIASPMDFATPNPTFALQSQILQQLLKESGIQLDLISLTNIEYYNKWYLRRFEDLTMNFVNTGDYGLNWYAQNRFKTGGFQNMSFIEDAEVDKVVAQIQVESDPAKLRQLARFLWDYDIQGSWQIWIQNETQFTLHNSRVRNFLNRAGGGFAAPTYFYWLSDAPRTAP
jgi:ABC-type transport system substrate-binding protein